MIVALHATVRAITIGQIRRLEGFQNAVVVMELARRMGDSMSCGVVALLFLLLCVVCVIGNLMEDSFLERGLSDEELQAKRHQDNVETGIIYGALAVGLTAQLYNMNKGKK
jgi:hypothetical protein